MDSVIATEYHTIPVLFESDDIIAVDKPAKLASIPERNPEKISLLKLLTEALHRKLYVVHRLDKQVSGVIVFAKNPRAHRHLNLLFEHRQVGKTYIALVHGLIDDASGVIEKPLRRFGSGRMREDAGRGKPCRTEFTVEARPAGLTLVRVSPLTGRKHQIRSHFYSIGHPIVGDVLYGDKALQKTFPRLMLHALSICLNLPTGEYACFESELPSVFKKYFPHK